MAPPKKRKPAPQAVGVASVKKSQAPLVAGVLGVIALLALIAIIIAVVSNKGDESANGGVKTAEWQTVSAVGATLPAVPDSGADVAVGSPAPELRGKDFAGNPVTITKDGKAKVVMFFAHWCPHCRAEAPLLSDYIKDNKDKYPVEYYAVATGTSATQANYPPSDWFKEMNFPTPVLVDDHANPAAEAYGLKSYPYMVFMGADGNVVSRASGELGMDVFDQYVAAAAGTGTTPTTTASQADTATPVG